MVTKNKKPINIWDVDINNIVTSNLIEAKKNSKYLIEYLNEVLKPLVLILPKLSRYIKTFKDKDGNRKNKLMTFYIDDENLLQKSKRLKIEKK